jgi:muramoyltetrapeptide carboxypeptidase
MYSINKPTALKYGDRVKIIAPGGHFDQQYFNTGVNFLSSWGLKVEFRDDIFAKQDYLAGSDERRLLELHEAFVEPHTKAIFVARGGFGTTRLLPQLNRQLFRQHPKLLVGFSDITALLNYLTVAGEQPSIHGPLVTWGFDRESSPDLHQLLWRLMSVPESTVIPLDGEVLKTGRASGQLLGGNLTVLQSMVGTPWLPDFSGALLFLEEVNEAAYRLDRILSQLQQLGIFSKIAGLIVGELGTYDRDLESRLVNEFFGDLNIPIVMGCRIGHPMPLFPLPIGVRAQMDTTRSNLIVEAVVR